MRFVEPIGKFVHSVDIFKRRPRSENGKVNIFVFSGFFYRVLTRELMSYICLWIFKIYNFFVMAHHVSMYVNVHLNRQPERSQPVGF